VPQVVKPASRADAGPAACGQENGNPLYAEQYVQMLAEHGTGQELPVPESIQGIISARLDLLAPPEKRLLQDAAVIGEIFWPSAVTALGAGTSSGELDEAELQEHLHELERRQFIRRERASSLAGETQYAFVHVLVRDVAYGQIPRAARASKHIQAAGWIESLGRPEDQAEMLAHHYLSALELARGTDQDTRDLAPQARAALQAAGDRAVTLNAYATAAGYYRAALALWPQEAQKQRVGLLRLLGTVLSDAGEMEQAEQVLAEGAEAAAAAGLPEVQARIHVVLADIHNLQGQDSAAALAECEAAAAVLEAGGDLEGLAEAWIVIGRLRFWLGESPADQEALERAMAYARQAGCHRTWTLAASWLGVTLITLPVPADAAIGRAEQLLQAVSGDPWDEAEMLQPLSKLYAYAGRFADAKEAIARAVSVYGRSEAVWDYALAVVRAGEIELIVGDPAAAEPLLMKACEALRALEDRGFLSSAVATLAEAVYLQGRLGEAEQMTEESETLAFDDDIDAQTRWRATRAKVLARRRQFPAARQLADEAVTLVSKTSTLRPGLRPEGVALRAVRLTGRDEPGTVGGWPMTSASGTGTC
jgi:predicted ATPase